MLVLGLTGDVGAGKTTVASLWEAAGASIVDADRIVRSLWRNSSVISMAAARWGEDILDPSGIPIPAAIASRAFKNREEYRWLCSLLHPLVRIEMERQIASLEGWVVAEIPLLFESGVPEWIDAVVYVTAPEEFRTRRNLGRGWDEEEIRRRESFLLPREEKKTRSRMVIDNDGTLEELHASVGELGAFFRRAASIVRCTALFREREKAEELGVLLKERRLCSGFFREGGGNQREHAWMASFFTREEFFPLVASLADSAPHLWMDRIRRMPYERRLSILEELVR